MVYNFDSREKQVSYISKFVRRYTDVNLKCQFCGKDGRIHNNYIGDPYKIQIVCLDCKKKYRIKSNSMCNNIPTINLKDHIIKGKLKYVYLSDELVSKINKLTHTKQTRCKALKEIGLYNKNTFEKIISEYEKIYDKNIRSKLDKVFKKNRCKRAREVIIGLEVKESKNNIAKYKLLKGITNRDIQGIIYKKHKVNIYNNTISNLSKGKQNATPRIRCYIAEALDVSLGDLFPEYKSLNINTYQDYLDLNDKMRKSIEKQYIDSASTPLCNLAKTLCISENIMYAFCNGVVNLSLDNLLKVTRAFKV
jgi:transcriptional regulator with XRE-family HTH domain